MGKREAKLREYLRAEGLLFFTQLLPVPTLDTLAPIFGGELMEVYEALGGNPDAYCLPSADTWNCWDVELDGLAVELDEEQYFNEYRHRTLDSPVYEDLPHFPRQEYREYCSTEAYKEKCLKKSRRGEGYWGKTGTLSARQFGPPTPFGEFRGNGAPRWKQRAFYDFAKDVSQLVLPISVARISIWDEVNVGTQTLLVRQVLDSRRDLDAGPALCQLIARRVAGLGGQFALIQH